MGLVGGDHCSFRRFIEYPFPPTVTTHYIGTYFPDEASHPLAIPTRRPVCCLNTSLAIRSLSGRDYPAHIRFRDYHHSPRIDDGDRSHTRSPLPTQTRELNMTERGRKKVSLNRWTFISRLITHARIVIRSREWHRRRCPDIPHRLLVKNPCFFNSRYLYYKVYIFLNCM